MSQPPAMTPAQIDCETAARRLWDYLDANLDDVRAAEVEAHLETCLKCPPHYTFARQMLDALEASRREPEGITTLRQRVVDALRATGFRGGAR